LRPNDEQQKRYIVALFSILAHHVDPLVGLWYLASGLRF